MTLLRHIFTFSSSFCLHLIPTPMAKKRRVKRSKKFSHSAGYTLTVEDIDSLGKHVRLYADAETDEKSGILGGAAEEILAELNAVSELTMEEEADVIRVSPTCLGCSCILLTSAIYF